MDKKLILNIENIEYTSKKSEVKSSFDDLKNNIELLPKVLKLFQEIKINRLKIDDNEFEIILDNDDLYLDNKFINISSKIDNSSNQVVFDLYSLYLKDLELLVDGKIKIDYFKEELNYYGNFYYQDIQSSLNLDMTKKLAKFYITSEPFKSLKFLKKFIDLPLIAEEWMYDNVEGDINLKEFYGEFDLEKKEIIEESLRGKAQIYEAKIRFHKDVDIVNTKILDVVFKNNQLHFELVEPVFKNKKLDGSYVTIHNLASEKDGVVDVYLKTNSMLDKDILEILKAYKINLPLVQKTGNTEASLLLKFPYSLEKKMTSYGEFLVFDAQVAIGNFVFFSKNAKVILDDTIVKIIESDFKHKNMIDAIVNLDIDTHTLKSTGNANIKSFMINQKDDTSLIDIKNKNSEISIDFDKETIIKLKELDTQIKISDFVYVNIKDLAKIYPYSQLLKSIPIKEGTLDLNIIDENNITFNTFIKGLNLPLQKNNQMIESLVLSGEIKEDITKIISSDKNLKIEIDNDLNIYLNNIDVLLDTKNKEDSTFNQKMNIFLNNSKLNIDNSIYEIKNAEVKFNNSEIDFEARVTNLDLPLKKDDKKIEELHIFGKYNNDYTKINTKNNDLILELKKDELKLNLTSYDLYYNINESYKNSYKKIDILGKYSNIFLNNTYKFLADDYEIRIRDNSKFIKLSYKDTDITIKESEDKKLDIFSNAINDEFVNTIFDKKIFEGGKLMLLANGDINNLNGKLIIENSNIKELAILNNLLLFIQTSPALINPFLAIPSVVGMATNDGFNILAYKIVNGTIEFNYNQEKELLDIKKLVTVGNGIDLDGKGSVDLKNMTLQSDIKLIFLKDYSKIVGMIPVVNYVLLGESNRVETKVNIFGDLNNPKISTNLTKDAFSVPLNITKRILTSPGLLYDFITGKESEEEKLEKQNMINKPLE
uniref:YhdP family protein n=1 Tax=Aliarcobacter sp. TaxID=2321116 RepID=UPI0040487D4C